MISLKKLTIRDIFFRSRMAYSERPALAFVGSEPLSYADMAIIVRNISGMLNTLGVKKGDKVALIGENSPNWGMAYFSITTIGAVVVPILPDFSGSEMESIIHHSEAKVVFVSARLYNQLNLNNLKKIDAFVLINNLQAIDEQTANVDSAMPYTTPAIKVNTD